MANVSISVKQGRRIAAAVKTVEQGYTRDQRRAPSSPWTPAVVRAKVTTAIPTGTFASPSSSGAAQIYAKDQTGAWVASGSAVKVWNDHTLSASIAAGKVVKLAWCSGDWYLVAADC